jgi:hypothetical protein
MPLAILAVLLLGGFTALGCPVCHSGTGDAVRAGIFNEHFGRNLSATLLPFPIFGLIIAWLHSGGRGSDGMD